MATAAENLETSITQITDRIVSVTASDQPDYSIDGESISKGAYLEQLHRSLDALLGLRVKLSGPFLVRSRGRAV